MKQLDHTVLRVSNKKRSLRFYEQIFGFMHEGKAGPFDILRVTDDFTLDLLEEEPRDSIHLAFSMRRTEFNEVKVRLETNRVDFGNGPHDRNDRSPARWFGARGMADALYFHDPDQHILEIRTYEPE